MPTAKPRITITLTEQQHDVLMTLAHIQKVSMSSIVVDLVETTLPVLSRLAEVLKNAADAPQSVRDEIRKSAERAESDMAGHGHTMLEQLDFLVAASSGAGVREQPAPEVAAKTERPPTSNRGVRNTSPRAKIESISPMKKARKTGGSKK